MDHKDHTRAAVEVMQACLDGADIECKLRGNPDSLYSEAKHPIWDWERYDYRVAKPRLPEWDSRWGDMWACAAMDDGGLWFVFSDSDIYAGQRLWGRKSDDNACGRIPNPYQPTYDGPWQDSKILNPNHPDNQS